MLYFSHQGSMFGLGLYEMRGEKSVGVEREMNKRTGYSSQHKTASGGGTATGAATCHSVTHGCTRV